MAFQLLVHKAALTADQSVSVEGGLFVKVMFDGVEWTRTTVRRGTASSAAWTHSSGSSTQPFDDGEHQLTVHLLDATEFGDELLAHGTMTVKEVLAGPWRAGSAWFELDKAKVSLSVVVLDAAAGAEDGYSEELRALYDEQAIDRVLLPVGQARAAIDQVLRKFEETRVRFVDDRFPPRAASLNRRPADERAQVGDDVIFQRCQDFMDSPMLYSDGIAPADAKQGHLGNCWLVGGIASAATNPQLVKELFYPPCFNEAGVYGVRLWRRGEWVMVVVDDYVPVLRLGGRMVPAFVTSTAANEMWTILVEKAFAKVFGSYQDLWPTCSMSVQPLSALSGGVCSFYYGKDPDPYFAKIKQYLDNNWPVGCGGSKGQEDGVVLGHAYSVLAYAEVGEFRLVRLRNTWGQHEWTGAWGDKSELWEQHPEVRDAVEYVDADDGEFWISVEDMVQHFGTLDLCRLDGQDDPDAKTLSPEFCWSDTYADYAGTEGFEATTRVAGRWGEVNEAGTLELWGSTQYKVELDQDCALRFCISRGDGTGMPTVMLFKGGKRVGQLDGERKLGQAYGSEWTDVQVKAEDSPFVLVPTAQGCTDTFEVVIKAPKQLNLTPLPPIASVASVKGEWAGETAAGMLEGAAPQYVLEIGDGGGLVHLQQTVLGAYDLFDGSKSGHGLAVVRASQRVEEPACCEEEELAVVVPSVFQRVLRWSGELDGGKYVVCCYADDEGWENAFRVSAWGESVLGLVGV